MKPCTALVACVLLAACGGEPGQTAGAARMPAPQLTPFLDELNRLAAAIAKPDDKTLHELKDLADIALGTVEADHRTATRAERSLLEHPAAAAVLEPALAAEDVAIRRRAAWLCGRTHRSILQFALLFRLKYETDAETVVWIGDALQRLGNDTGLGWISPAMTRQETAETAGRIAIEICQERAIPLAEQPTYDELRQHLDALYASWLRTGVGGRNGVEPPTGPELDGHLAAHLATTQAPALRPIDEARYVLVRCGHLAVPMLVRTLRASESYLRTMALQVLTELGPAARAAGGEIQKLLGDPFTALYAVRALGEVGESAALPYLRAMLQEGDTELRAASAQALGLLGDATSSAALTARMQDPAETLDVRVNAAFALCCLGDAPTAQAFLAERRTKGDYHAPTLQILVDKLAARRR